LTGAHVHPDTARRHTEAAGAMRVAHETAEAARILREHPDPLCTSDTLLSRVDGTMIPLVHGQWTEVRTLAVGEVQPATPTAAGPVVRTARRSHFSRRVDSSTFSDLATLELHWRGIAGARRVGVVVDGTDWCQTFVDDPYPDTVRILDLPHAAAHVTPIVARATEVNVRLPAATLAVAGVTLPPEDPMAWCQVRKYVGPAVLLPALRATIAAQPTNQS